MYDAVSEVKTYDLEEIYVTGNAFEDNKKIGKRLLFGLAIGAIPTECGWAISESLMVPFMLSLDVPHSFVALHWLPAPLIGFFTHRFFGRWSDNCGSRGFRPDGRIPFFISFSIFSILGLCLVPYSRGIADAMFPHGGTGAHITVAIFFFALMDSAHDLMLGPSRTILVDRLSSSQLESGVMYYGGASALGRLLGYAVAAIPWERDSPFETRMSGTFNVSAILVCVIVAIVTLSAIRVETRLSDHLVEIKDQPNMKVSDIPGRLWLIWSLVTCSWFSHTVMSWYFTSFIGKNIYDGDPNASHHSTAYNDFERGVQMGTIAWTLQSISGIFYTIKLQRHVNARFGVLPILIFAEIFSALLMMAYYWMTHIPLILFAHCFYGFAFQIHMSNIFIILETELLSSLRRESSTIRGYMIGLVNTGFAMAQCAVAATSGFFLSSTDFKDLIFWSGTLLIFQTIMISLFLALGHTSRIPLMHAKSVSMIERIYLTKTPFVN